MIWKIWKKSKLNSEKIWRLWKKSKLNSEKIWKIQKKIVKGNGNYERKISWIVNRFGKYRRKLWNYMKNIPYHFTIQPTFLPYFRYHVTIFFCIFQFLSLFDLPFLHIFHIFSLFSWVTSIFFIKLKWYGKYGRKASRIVIRYG
jgi:hypothetical protein